MMSNECVLKSSIISVEKFVLYEYIYPILKEYIIRLTLAILRA